MGLNAFCPRAKVDQILRKEGSLNFIKGEIVQLVNQAQDNLLTFTTKPSPSVIFDSFHKTFLAANWISTLISSWGGADQIFSEMEECYVQPSVKQNYLDLTEMTIRVGFNADESQREWIYPQTVWHAMKENGMPNVTSYVEFGRQRPQIKLGSFEIDYLDFEHFQTMLMNLVESTNILHKPKYGDEVYETEPECW